jgi:hypothetical protein
VLRMIGGLGWSSDDDVVERIHDCSHVVYVCTSDYCGERSSSLICQYVSLDA